MTSQELYLNQKVKLLENYIKSIKELIEQYEDQSELLYKLSKLHDNSIKQ